MQQATPAAYPLALVRLAHALLDAGYQAVAAPACAGCGRITIDLRRKTASGRVCGTCAARDAKETCARCGQPKRIYARRPEGGTCSACYDKDEHVVTECNGCGRKRRAATRMPDGSARCQFCTTRPARTCSACGQQRTVAGTTDAGPVCASCYQAPQRPCGRCGRTRKVARRATASAPDLCYSCYQGTSAVCSVCGEIGPCQRISSGSPICRGCRAVLPGPATGAGAIAQSRRNGPSDRSVPAATSMSAATQPSAQDAERYVRWLVATPWEGRSAARAPEFRGWTTPAVSADGEERSTAGVLLRLRPG